MVISAPFFKQFDLPFYQIHHTPSILNKFLPSSTSSFYTFATHRRYVCYPCDIYFRYYEIIALNSKESMNEKKRGGNCCGSAMNLGGREESMCQSINILGVTSSPRDYRAVNNDNWKYLLSHTLNKAFSLFPG